jgi:hypothetical protein
VIPPDGVAPLNVTVHVKVPAPISDVGLQLNEVNAGSGNSVMVTLRDTPFNAAVTVRVTLVGTALAVTINVPVVDPPGTVTDAGVVRYEPLSVSPMVKPPAGAAVLSTTVHTSDSAPVINPVPHVREDSCERMKPGKLRAVPVTGTAFPAAEAPKVLLKVSVAPAEPDVSVADTLAITPAGMLAVFIPAAMHVYAPACAWHDRSLSEAVNDGPAVALIEGIADAGY